MSSENVDLDALREARWFAGKGRAIAHVRVAAELAGGALRIADVAYSDDGAPERYLLIADDARWVDVLRADDLELRVTDAALLEARGVEAIPSTDQSNTLVAIDDTLLVKAYRKLEAGVHPEVELGAALAGSGAPVPRHAGSLHWGDTAIALLQEFVPGAESGWEAPIEAVAAALRAGATPDLAPYVAAGEAAGALHAALARRLGTAHDAEAPRRWLADAHTALADAVALEPAAAEHEDALRERLASLGGDDAGGARTVGRVHGDLHYAQFLRTPDRLLIVDLEGDPTAPLAARRRLNTPLRDLAALLRSIDHIGTAGSRRADWADPAGFVARASAAARAAYEDVTGAPVDADLLAALEVASECRELVYAHRVVPEWLYAPRAGLTRLLQQGPTPS
jgi:maltokinase